MCARPQDEVRVRRRPGTTTGALTVDAGAPRAVAYSAGVVNASTSGAAAVNASTSTAVAYNAKRSRSSSCGSISSCCDEDEAPAGRRTTEFTVDAGASSKVVVHDASILTSSRAVTYPVARLGGSDGAAGSLGVDAPGYGPMLVTQSQRATASSWDYGHRELGQPFRPSWLR
ncbi:unnamed protein product [Prorocentrum cordatum]|uniref:Uncharacterized protein n=1 Tax=Prorocentrum cordatum TaxID=2364126 RepID=A0ABN9U9A4_9DINO|nr:unnamed protein product [Polarella glacialis]